ncbi:MAG TPA: citrate (Si)-synthase [Saprospiraceae bacterium]|nr:citrate (Si)-synthase [Saprospiraceae bacterium]MCB9329055.1 citrate (Si)-synthase [Lewinellaceae bacterium]HPK09338.1 citrate (Si)-synthase [Saprospiraceae bacterium]HRX28706.1 citrate (Si)-synthase [Saprospiraceae bacterium]
MDQLKEKFFKKSQELRLEIKGMLAEHGNEKLDEVSISQAYGGMRGIKCMIWETSSLDPVEGIRFRGYSIPQLRELLPKVPGGKEPLPEGLFWLMLVDEIPTKAEVDWLSDEWRKRATIDPSVYKLLDTLPVDTHPMTQFTIGIMALQPDSIFAKRYDEGMNKRDYWDASYEDTMNLIAKLPRLAAYIYRRTYYNSQHIAPDESLDWAANFAHMLGYENKDFKSLMRLYLTIHADHEGGNASAHTVHLVGSTLSDAYLSLAAGINALAGPLHGLANQEVIKWIFNMVDHFGSTKLSKDQIAMYVQETLDSGQVIPGYGHAVLRQPDPRYMAQREFAKEYIKNDDIVNIVWTLFDVVPDILAATGKVKNPWPNVDAHSGSILVHYGFKEYNYYTVLFGVSRALGVLASNCWSRALGFPIERPKSLTTVAIKEFISKN